MAEEARDEQFQQVLDALRIATNLSIGAGPDRLYDLLDAVENLIHPDYEGDEGGVHEALDVFEFNRLQDERTQALEEAAEEACDTLPTRVTIDGTTYSLTPLDEG